MSGEDLNVKIDATTKDFEASLARAQRATLNYDSSLARLSADIRSLEKEIDDQVNGALERQHAAMTKTGQAATAFGAAVLAGFALATNEAVKWESAWTGVTKTVSGSTEQMGELEGQLRQLAKTLPASHEEIAAVAESAGQLGVQRENVAAFTKTMIDLGQTTNMTADEAATAIAQFMNVMGAVPSDVERVGSSLAYLGNKGASTEADIMELAKRLSGAGKLIGASEPDVLALAASMANLGIQADLGGGAASRVLLRLYQTVKGGGAALDQLAHVAGTTGEKFAEVFGKDPVHAFDMVLQGLGRVKASGGDVIGVLGQLGIHGTQNLQVMLRLAGAGDQVSTSLEQSRHAWEANNALVNEANQRYQTTASKIAVARNNLRDAAITVGGSVLPALSSLAGVVADLASTWEDLPGPLRTTMTILGLAAGAVSLFGGAALMAIPKIVAFKAAITELQAGPLKTAGTKLMGLGSILAGPWGLAIAGGIAALTIFAVKHGEAARQVDDLKATLDAQTGAITENSRQWAIKKLNDEGALSSAKTLGLNLATVTDAALGNKDALASVNGALQDLIILSASTGSGVNNYTGAQIDASNKARVLSAALNDTNGTLAKSRTEWELQHEAMGATGTAAKSVTGAQKGTTQAWKDGAAAASDLTQETKTLGQELQDLSADYLNQRDAGRQVRQSLRDIRDALHQYRKDHGSLQGAFKAGTKSGDEFSAMLDGLAKHYQNQIDTTEKLTGSEDKVQAAYNRSRKKLIEVAQELGMTKKAAQDYADHILDMPAVVQTHFETPGLPTAVDALDAYAALLGRVPRYIRTQIVTQGEDKFTHLTGAQALGGDQFPGGRYLVGEHGPEIVEPKAPMTVTPHGQSRNRLNEMFTGRSYGSSDLSGAAASLQRAADKMAGGSSGLPRRVQLVVEGQAFTALVRDIAAGEVTANDDYGRVTGRRPR